MGNKRVFIQDDWKTIREISRDVPNYNANSFLNEKYRLSNSKRNIHINTLQTGSI